MFFERVEEQQKDTTLEEESAEMNDHRNPTEPA